MFLLPYLSGDPEELGRTHRLHLPFPCAVRDTRDCVEVKELCWEQRTPHGVVEERIAQLANVLIWNVS